MMGALMIGSILSAGAVFSPLDAFAASTAEIAQVDTTYSFDIASQDVDLSLTEIADQANVKLFFPSKGLSGSAPAIKGDLTLGQALDLVLKGTGYSWQIGEDGTVTILKNKVSGDDNTLAPIMVTANTAPQTATGHVDGYVATVTTAGSKTDTPILEVPQTVSVVTSDEIKDRNAKTLSDVTKYTPGVLSDLYGADPRGYDQLYMRGFTNFESGDFRDGLRMAGAGFAVYATEPYGLERVDILKGANASIYGQGDAGGVVNRVTKRPDADQTQEIVAEVGSWDHFQGSFDIGGKANDDGTVLFRVNGVLRDANGEYKFLNGDDQKNNRIYLAPSVTWQPNTDTSLTILTDFLYDDRSASYDLVTLDGQNYDFLSGEPGFDRFENQQVSIASLLDHRVSDRWSLHQKTRYTSVDTEARGVIGLFAATDGTLYRRAYITDNQVQSLALDNYLEGKFDGKDISQTVTVGLDGSYSFNDYKYMQNYPADTINLSNPAITGATSYDLSVYSDGITSTDYEQKTFQYGLYGQDQIKILDHWMVTAGGRYSYVNTDTDYDVTDVSVTQRDEALTGRLALSYLFDSGVAPYVSYSQGFAPVSGTDAQGNAFDPEKSTQYEVGVKYQPHGMDALITASVYQLTKNNAVSTDPDNTLFSIQTDEVRSRGVELEAKASLGDGWDVTASYAYTDSDIRKSVSGYEGNEATWVPSNTAASWVNYTFDGGVFDGVSAGVGVRYIGSYFVDEANSLKIDGYTLVDMGVKYKFTDHMTLGVNATNLMDKQYVTTCDVGSVCYAGDGRKVYANLTYDW